MRSMIQRNLTHAASMADNPGYWARENSFFGLADDESADVPWYTQIAQAVTPLATSVLNVYSQAQLQKLNRDRLAAGQAPLAPEQYAQMYPTATVQAGLTPDTKRLLTLGALGLGGFLIVKMILKR